MRVDAQNSRERNDRDDPLTQGDGLGERAVGGIAEERVVSVRDQRSCGRGNSGGGVRDGASAESERPGVQQNAVRKPGDLAIVDHHLLREAGSLQLDSGLVLSEGRVCDA